MFPPVSYSLTSHAHVCVHKLTRCATSGPYEWDFSHESAWMSDLSGFKKLSEWEGTLTHPDGLVLENKRQRQCNDEENE